MVLRRKDAGVIYLMRSGAGGGRTSRAQHGNVAVHSQSLAGDGSITAICYLAKTLNRI